MAKSKLKAGGGWPAIRYSLKKARESGGITKFIGALHSKNTCKTCALGMGGQNGGMRNEAGEKFQVCKKSMQAQAQDMRDGIPESFWGKYSVADLRTWSGLELEAAGRIVQPLYYKKGLDHFEPLTWDKTIALLLEKWKSARPERSFMYTSGRSSMEAAFLVQLLGRQWGTNNINNCSYYCHQASGVGLGKSLGSGTATVNLSDVEKSDLVVVIGANPASNHPRFMTHLAKVRKRGGNVLIINPFIELGLKRFKIPSDAQSLLFGSDIASLYLQPHCGGDLSFLKAAAVYLYQLDLYDKDYLSRYCDGEKSFLNDLDKENLNDLLEKSGLMQNQLEEFCNYLINSRHTIFAWAMGITHHEYGTETVQAITNLALMLGAIGKSGSGLLPLRGHSNVQGIGSVGVVPVLKPEMASALINRFNIRIPEKEGFDTYRCMLEAHKGNMDFAVLLGGNLFGSNPDSSWAEKSLSRIKFKCLISTTLNQGHIFGLGKETLIIPVRTRDEEEQSTSQESMFNYVRLSLGGAECVNELLPSETALFSDIGLQLLGKDPVPWHELHEHANIRNYISEIVPGMAPLADIAGGNDFSIPGRLKHQPSFNTKNMKAQLAVIQARDGRPQKGFFNMTTFRSEGQFNTIVYEEADIYRGVEHRRVIFMGALDMSLLKINEGQMVSVTSSAGTMQVEAVSGPIREGNTAMYWPEANKIVPRNIDPLSGTPSFKRIQVQIKTV